MTSLRPVLAVHGGAGRLRPERLESPGRDDVQAGLRDALRAGLTELERGASAVDVVTAAVRALEDCPHFNAGRGAELCDDGSVELSASIMDGSTRDAGAVAVVRCLRNPVEAARALLGHRHVLLVGEPAERFALESGCASADEECVEVAGASPRVIAVAIASSMPTG